MSLITTLKEIFVGDGSEASGETTTERNYSDSSVESETDFVGETGNARKETLLELVTSRGGRVQQAELIDLTGWSKSMVSRKLGELETDDEIVRKRFGRHKVVFLPDDSHVTDPSVADTNR